MTVRSAVIAAALAALLVPASASAEPDTATPWMAAKTRVAVRVARTTWGTDACPAGVTHRWVTDAERPRTDSGDLIVSPTSPAWVSTLGGCEVTFYEPNAREYMRDAEWWCEIVVHEYGHAVAGLPDLYGGTTAIMETRLSLGNFQPCRRAAAQLERHRLRVRASRANRARASRNRLVSATVPFNTGG